MSFSTDVVKTTQVTDGRVTPYFVTFEYIKTKVKFEDVEIWDLTVPATPVLYSLQTGDYSVDETSFTQSTGSPPDNDNPSTGTNAGITLLMAGPTFSQPPFSGVQPNGMTLVIYRDTEDIQETDFQDGPFVGNVSEEAHDKAFFAIQENKELLKRAVINPTFPPSGSNIDIQDIIDNTNNIASNLLEIQSNDADILALQAALGALGGGEVIQNRTIAGTYPTIAQDFNIVTIAGVILTLPALPVIGTTIKVKQDNLSGTIVNASHNIDGFLLTYTLLSNYESVILVFNGTQWYIN